MERRKSTVAGCVASPTDSSHVRLRYTYDGMGGDRSSVAMSNRAVLMAAVPKGFSLSRNGEKEKRSCQLRRWPNRLQPHGWRRYAIRLRWYGRYLGHLKTPPLNHWSGSNIAKPPRKVVSLRTGSDPDSPNRFTCRSNGTAFTLRLHLQVRTDPDNFC